MRKTHLTQRVLFGALLILLSVCFYVLHFVIFRDAHHIFIYLLGDIGFVFIEVLLVTLIIHHLLAEREKRAMLKFETPICRAFPSSWSLVISSQASSISSSGSGQ